VALGEALEGGRLDLEGRQALLFGLLNPLAFDEEIGRHIARFSGREWASRAVKNWLADPAPPSRIFWIVGPPGIGKTAIAVQIATTRPEIVAWHFCHFGHIRKSDPASCVTSIAYQLAAQLPDYFQRLLRVRVGELLERTSDARTLFDELIVQPLFNLPDPGRVMAVLIDALDEATRDGKNDLASFIANDFERVPAWLRVIVTSRLTPELVTAFAGRQPFDLSATS
jgi:MoxR-like ATPase